MFNAVILIILIFISIIFHDSVIAGTAAGLLMWYRTLIPALLPYIIITNALFETHSYDHLAYIFRKKAGKSYRYIAMFLGNICGYPIGAKILNDFVISDHISSESSNSLLSFSSQANPMFLLCFVYPMIPEETVSLPVFLFLIYFPQLLLYFIYTRYKIIITDDCHFNSLSKQCSNKQTNISGTFIQAVTIMVVIGVYVIIFSILLTILLPLLHCNISKYIISFLEITNGIKLISTLNINGPLKAGLLTALSSFGGLCAAFQIKCVLTYQGATIKKYLIDKLIISTGTFILTLLYLRYR